MRRHPLDVFAFLAGLLFFALGVLYVVGAYTNLKVNMSLVLPLLFIWLGVAGLVGALVAQRRSDAKVAASAAVPAATDEPALDVSLTADEAF